MTALLVAAVAISIIAATRLSDLVDLNAPMGNRWIRHRVTQAIDYLSSGPLGPQTVIFIGASDVEVGIDPSLIDFDFAKLGVNSQSLNFGFRNLSPLLLKSLTERMNGSFLKRKVSVNSIVVKFTPFRSTKVFTTQADILKNFTYHDEVEAAVYDPTMIFKLALTSPTEASEIFTTKFLLGGCSAAAMTANLWDFILLRLQKVYQTKSPLISAANKAYFIDRAIWHEPEFHSEPAWSSATRGRFYFGYPATQQRLELLFNSLKEHQVADEYAAKQNRNGDGQNFVFDPVLIDAFIDSLKMLKVNAKHVAVFYYPEFTKQKRTDAARANLEAAFERMRLEADVNIFDYSALSAFVPEKDYFDDFHLNLFGQAKLANLLTRDLSKNFRD